MRVKLDSRFDEFRISVAGLLAGMGDPRVEGLLAEEDVLDRLLLIDEEDLWPATPIHMTTNKTENANAPICHLSPFLSGAFPRNR
jgi:hypothetical protein